MKFLTNLLTNQISGDIINAVQTVEAEIKMIMPSQRACAAESQVKHRSSNGPLRVQSNGCIGMDRAFVCSSVTSRVFCDVRMCVKHQGYACILQVHGDAVNQGGTADIDYSSLTDLSSVRDFFVT